LFSSLLSQPFLPQHRSLLEVVHPERSEGSLYFVVACFILLLDREFWWTQTGKGSPRNKKGSRKKRPPFPQLKINLNPLSQFPSQKKTGQRTTFITQSTTTSPQRHHA
jgi:hypothetical protein